MMNRLRPEAVTGEEPCRQLDTARAADRQWRATRLADLAAQVRPLQRLADHLERAGTLVVMCLFLAVGVALIFFGLDRAGPYFRHIPPELPLGVILALAGFAIPAQFAHLAAQLRAHAEALLKREGLTISDLPEEDG